MKTELNYFMKKLKSKKKMLTVQQYNTLKGQAIAGDTEGAEKGFQKLLGRGATYAH